MRILAIIRGYYGERIVSNISKRAKDWDISYHKINITFPSVIDDPEEYIDKFFDLEISDVDLLLYMPENQSAYTLLPEFMRKFNLKRAIAPVDDYNWLPRGLEKQILEEAKTYGLKIIFPRPFCSLTKVGDKVIDSFTRKFGSPRFSIKIKDGVVKSVRVLRNTPCGSAYFVSRKILGLGVKEAPSYAGLYTQTYPCLATHTIDPLLKEEMIHLSASIMKEAVNLAIKKSLEKV